VRESRSEVASGINRIACGAPRESPMPQTSAATKYGPKPEAGPESATALEKIAPTAKTSTRVPRISLIRFAPNLRIAALCRSRRV
jgi:hypothetical protein